MPRFVVRTGRALAWLYLQPAAHAADWKPLDPADLALKGAESAANRARRGDPREVRVSDELDGAYEPRTIYESYLKIKILTDRGQEDTLR